MTSGTTKPPNVPRLYALSKFKHDSVKDMWNPHTNDWDIQIQRPLRDHEVQIWNDIKVVPVAPNQDRGASSPIWKINPDGVFDIASVKRALIDNDSFSTTTFQPNIFKVLWKSDIPKKMQVLYLDSYS
ncbi:LINE-1 retrotransposable element ORF2 protein [Cucumis melo var. makuwa]|uniref:LINE-1 retrotransposable element ORF2 protein n=1 Tax=Cucumis melo var. makuwa TaxID=1194695 RepID=A0A5D3DDJ7_CUCMM|nr:LINE-1 retrotransposable element ORF2 protein [Cucumis melo var. makuwa]